MIFDIVTVGNVTKCHTFSNLGTKLRLPFMYGLGSERFWVTPVARLNLPGVCVPITPGDNSGSAYGNRRVPSSHSPPIPIVTPLGGYRSLTSVQSDDFFPAKYIYIYTYFCARPKKCRTRRGGKRGWRTCGPSLWGIGGEGMWCGVKKHYLLRSWNTLKFRDFVTQTASPTW